MERIQAPKFEISPEKVYKEQELYNLISRFIAYYGKDIKGSLEDQLRGLFNNDKVYLNSSNIELNFDINSLNNQFLAKDEEKNKEVLLICIYIHFVNMTEKAYELIKKHNEIFKNQKHNDLSTKEKACEALTEKLNLNGDFRLECLEQLNSSIDENKEYMIQIPEKNNQIYCLPLVFLDMTEEQFNKSCELSN